MKKILSALALLAATASTSATSLVVEYDYNHVVHEPAGYTHNQYGYVGLIESTKFGMFDAGWQGAVATTKGHADNQDGWEVGYSYALPVGKFTILPRIAYGAMNNIDGGTRNLNARYWLGSVEANTPLTSTVGTYVSFSHMNGTNADSIKRANRVQAGLDFAVTKDFSVRAGLSTQKFGDDRLNGGVLIGTYSF